MPTRGPKTPRLKTGEANPQSSPRPLPPMADNQPTRPGLPEPRPKIADLGLATAADQVYFYDESGNPLTYGTDGFRPAANETAFRGRLPAGWLSSLQHPGVTLGPDQARAWRLHAIHHAPGVSPRSPARTLVWLRRAAS